MKHIKPFKMFESEETFTYGPGERTGGGGILLRRGDKELSPEEYSSYDIDKKYRNQIRNNDSLDEIKKTISEYPTSHKSFNKRSGERNCHVAEVAADYNRKDVIQYLFDIGILKSSHLNQLRKWINHSYNLTPEEKEDMINFVNGN